MDTRKLAHPKHGMNTSDHTYQSITVDLVDKNESTVMSGLCGGTWNLMNQCRSRETNMRVFKSDYANNPWDMDEDLKGYLDRKEQQLNQITEIIRSGYDGKNAPLDFLLLQEIDVLTGPGSKVPPKAAARHNALKDKFYKDLRTLGWDIELSTRGSNGINQKAVAILYNTKSLTPNKLSAKGELPVTTGNVTTYTGYSCEFTHTKSKKIVKIASLHLEYTQDYSHSIPELQRQICAENKVGIMGGDTNHPANKKITGMICTWDNPTNLGAMIAPNQPTPQLTVRHEDTEIIKCYDGFFVNPTLDTRAVIMEGRGERFGKSDGEYYVERQEPNPHKHLSAPGEPWRRGGWNEYMKTLSVAAQKQPSNILPASFFTFPASAPSKTTQAGNTTNAITKTKK